MKLAYKLGLFVAVFSMNSFACGYATDRSVVSLSGPVTYYLKAMNLLKEPLQAVLELHNIDNVDFKGKQLAGGTFLSRRTLLDYQNSIVFFDKSRDLKNVLNKVKFEKIIEIESRGLDPFTVTNKIHEILKPYLKNCQRRWTELKRKYDAVKAAAEKFKSSHTFIFFLSEVNKERELPNLILLNDGPIGFWLQRKAFKSYPSDLAYVPWSQKLLMELQDLSQSLFYIGIDLKDSKKTYKRKGQYINILQSSALIPGIPQIKFMKNFMELVAKEGLDET